MLVNLRINKNEKTTNQEKEGKNFKEGESRRKTLLAK